MHGKFLQARGASKQTADAVARGNLDDPALDRKTKPLLEFVRKLTLEPAEVRDTDVQVMRDAGWTDEQIFEAAFDTALFAFFNRMAEAYGLETPPAGYRPPEGADPDAGKNRK